MRCAKCQGEPTLISTSAVADVTAGVGSNGNLMALLAAIYLDAEAPPTAAQATSQATVDELPTATNGQSLYHTDCGASIARNCVAALRHATRVARHGLRHSIQEVS